MSKHPTLVGLPSEARCSDHVWCLAIPASKPCPALLSALQFWRRGHTADAPCGFNMALFTKLTANISTSNAAMLSGVINSMATREIPQQYRGFSENNNICIVEKNLQQAISDDEGMIKSVFCVIE